MKPFEPIGYCTFRGKLSVAEISRRWQIFVRLDWKLVRGRWAFPTPKPLLSHVTSPPLCGSNSFSGARIKEAKTKLSTCTIFTTEIGVLYNKTNLLVSKNRGKRRTTQQYLLASSCV